MTQQYIVANTKTPYVGQPVRVINEASKHRGLKAEITKITLGVTTNLPTSITVKVYKSVRKTCSVNFRLFNSLESAE